MPTFNAQTGEMTGGDDLTTEPGLSAPLIEQDRERQEERARREQIGTGKTPPKDATKPGDAPPLTREQHGDRWDAMRARLIAEPGLAEDEAFMAEYVAMGSGAMGHGEEAGQEILGTLYEGARILAPEETPPVRIPALSEAARAAVGEEETEALIEHQETLVSLADQSGLPRAHLEGVFQDVAAALEDFARDDEADTPEAGRAELARLEGAGRAAQIEADAQTLIRLFYESGNPNLVAAAEDLIDLSNHPRVLIGAARLYQELKNLPPQGPWEQMLLSGARRWAQQQAAATSRAAKADEAPEDHVVSTGGRP